MAVAFNTNVSALEDELTHLILDGQISARIDSHAKVVEESGGGERGEERGEEYKRRTVVNCSLALSAGHVCPSGGPAQCHLSEGAGGW